MAPRQVRLDADVAALLDASRGTLSLSASANRVLRRALRPKPVRAPVAVPDVQPAQQGRPIRRRLHGARCAHPPGLRIGAHCIACGAKVR